jgi:hypothetical protein
MQVLTVTTTCRLSVCSVYDAPAMTSMVLLVGPNKYSQAAAASQAAAIEG